MALILHNKINHYFNPGRWQILQNCIVPYIVPVDDKSSLAQVVAWCHQAASHDLNQCSSRFVPRYGITRPQWVNGLPCYTWNCLPYFTKSTMASFSFTEYTLRLGKEEIAQNTHCSETYKRVKQYYDIYLYRIEMKSCYHVRIVGYGMVPW